MNKTNNQELQVGDKVEALVSMAKGREGTIVEIDMNRALPVAVEFDGVSHEMDFKTWEVKLLEGY